MLVFQFVEHAALDGEVHPYLPDPGPAVHAMAVMTAIGASAGFLLGWFWHWRNTPAGSAALGAIGFGAASGGMWLIMGPVAEQLMAEALAFALIGSIGGALFGVVAYYEKKDGVLTEVMNVMDLWDI